MINSFCFPDIVKGFLSITWNYIVTSRYDAFAFLSFWCKIRLIKGAQDIQDLSSRVYIYTVCDIRVTRNDIYLCRNVHYFCTFISSYNIIIPSIRLFWFCLHLLLGHSCRMTFPANVNITFYKDMWLMQSPILLLFILL